MSDSTIAEAQARVDNLRARFESYDGGDRAPSPPVDLIRALGAAEADLARLRATEREQPRILDLVIADLHARDAKGRETYGSSLRAGSANDALRFAYEEALDLAMYLRQELERRAAAKEPAR